MCSSIESNLAIPVPERVCLFGTDGIQQEPLMDMTYLQDKGYFGMLKEDRKYILNYPLKFVDWQDTKSDEILNNTNWLEAAVRSKNIDTTNKFTAYIRYGLLNNILSTIDGSRKKRWSVDVTWNGDGSVSLWKRKRTWYPSNLAHGALSTYLTSKDLQKQGETIIMGQTESYAAYRINYETSQLFLTKNPDGRLDEEFDENTTLVEIKSSPCGKENKYKCSSRRLSCFTDIKLHNAKYEDEIFKVKEIFNVKYIEKADVKDHRADENDHRFMAALLKTLEQQQEYRITRIDCYPPASTDKKLIYNDCVIMDNGVSIWIYEVVYSNNTLVDLCLKSKFDINQL